MRPSSSTLPALAGSSPATMRRNVVLPQPDGPTRAMNSPRSTARSMPSSTFRSPNDFPNPEIASFGAMAQGSVLGPRHELAFQPGEAGRHHDARDGEHHNTGKELGH